MKHVTYLSIAAFLLSFSLSVQAQCFGKQTQFVRRAWPWQMAAADLNHDGIPDLATVTLNSENPSYRGILSIYLGDGKGTFQRPRLHNYEAFGAVGLAVGDFDNDGNLDVIDVNMDLNGGPEGVGVFLGNGDGTFTRHTHHEARYHLDHVAVGDFNADGNLDAVVSSRCTGYVALFLGNGDGTLTGPVPIPTDIVSWPWMVLAADFDGDGIPDLALVPATVPTNVIEVRIANGDGTFHLGRVYRTNTPGSTVIVKGDFNEDGVIDLAVNASSRPSGVVVFLGNGDGSFQPAVKYPSRRPYDLLTADFNGDGHLDFVTMRSGGWSMLLGNGDGTFQAAVDHANLTKDEWTMVAPDLNGDGLPDLVISDSYNLAVFPNLGNCP